MKKIVFINRSIFILLLLAFVLPLNAQSDYELVKNFRQKYQQLEDAIKSAKTTTELDSLAEEIDGFRNEFSQHKALLDKSLYPGNFDKAFEKLSMQFLIRNNNLRQVELLQTENIQLKEQVEQLNKRNSELLSQIQKIEYSGKKENTRIVELQTLVADLKRSLKKRDDLIVSIVDSLMPQLMKNNASFTSKEKNELYLQAEKNNVLSNIKKSLRDNITFLEVTSLQPADLNEVKNQQEDFAEFWQDAGVKLVDIYAGNRKKAQEIAEIDSLFTGWQNAVDAEAWNSIREEFASNGILLIEFTNGEDFTKVVTNFIEEEIKNIGSKSKESSEKMFEVFTDSTWYKTIKPNWIPFLIKNEMLSAEQETFIEDKIADWENKLTPASFAWIYILVIALVVVFIIVIFLKRKKGMTSISDLRNKPD